jgi:RHS repeat-associated protein
VSQTVGTAGGTLILAPDVTLEFPANAVTETLAISLGPPASGIPVEGSILRIFSLNALSAATGQPVTQFQQSITITVSYDPSQIPASQQAITEIDYWDVANHAWSPLVSQVDLNAANVSASTTHFTDYSVINDSGSGLSNDVNWPQSSDVNNFQTDLYSGQTTFRYPIELPPGTGGFTPRLNIVGSSGDAYAKRRQNLVGGQYGPNFQEAGWLGLGLQLDIPYIEMHQVTISGSQQNRFDLFFNGASYKLEPLPSATALPGGATGQFRTESDQFYQILSFGFSPTSSEPGPGGQWTLTTRDGTVYNFGISITPGPTPSATSTSYPYQPKLQFVTFNDPSNQSSAATRNDFVWYLSKSADTSGNVATIGYDHFVDNNPQLGGTHSSGLGYSSNCWTDNQAYDQAVYPVVMAYSYVGKYGGGQSPANGSVAQVRVYFNRTTAQRYDFSASANTKLRWDNCIQSFYDGYALDSIDVKVLNSNGTERLVRHYQFSYGSTNGYVGGAPLTLGSIQECAASPCSNGATLPATNLTWSYYSDPSSDDNVSGSPYLLVSQVNNGYNGTVSYGYQIVDTGATYKDSWGANAKQLQIPQPQVSSRTANPGTSGGSASIVDSYAYSGGLGNSNPTEPEFRGYTSVTVTEGNKTTVHEFLQGGVESNPSKSFYDGTSFTDSEQMKGQEWRTTVEQGSVILQAQEKAYATVLPSVTPTATPYPAFVEVTAQEIEAYPVGSTNLSDPGRSITRTNYTYDVTSSGYLTSYGNVTATDEYDDSSGAPNLHRKTNWGYIVNSTAWIVDTPWYDNVSDASGTLLSSTSYYYDATATPLPAPPSETSPPTPRAGKVTMLRQVIRMDSTADLSGPCISCARTYYTYDAYGNRASVIDPNGYTTTTTYDATDTYPATVTFPVSAVGSATAQWDIGLGKPTSATDVNGMTTSYSYDPFGRLLTEVEPNDTAATPTIKRIYYDQPSAQGATDHSVTTFQNASPDPQQARTDYYDGFGRPIESKVLDELGNNWVTTFKTYDGNGRLQEESVPIEDTVAAVEQPNWGSLIATTYSYDALDRPASVTQPSSGTTYYNYTGWLSGTVDANLHCRSWNHDALGRVITAYVDDGTVTPTPTATAHSCGAAHLTSYTYDGADRLLGVTDPIGAQTTITYDLLGRKTGLADPDMGIWSYGYDNAGNLTSQTDARGQVTLYSYDALNRLTGIGTPAPTLISATTINNLRSQINSDRTNNGLAAYIWQSPSGTLTTANPVSAATFNEMTTAVAQISSYASSVSGSFTAGPISGPGSRAVRIADLLDLTRWVYATPTPLAGWSPTISYTYDTGSGSYLKGRRSAMTDQAGSTTYSYDARGRLSASSRSQDGLQFPSNFFYNDADQLYGQIYPDGLTETLIGYNTRGLPSSLQLAVTGNNPYIVSSATYDALGRPLTIADADGSSRTVTFDPTTTRLTSWHAQGNGLAVTRSYGYDAAGNLTCLDPSGTTPCSLTNPYVENFTYSAQNRLLSMAGPWLTDPDTYAYDAAGDLTTKTEAQTTVSLSGYLTGGLPAHAPASVNGTSYQYDKAGNLTSRGSTSYLYDWQNHLVQVTQNGQATRFTYDGDGNLAQRIDPNGTITDYVDDLYERNNTTGTQTFRYLFGNELVAQDSGMVRSYFYPDYLGSTIAATGGVTVEYAPFGLVRSSSGNLPTDHQFQGQQNQASVGLYHMGARWYDPSIGLWTQPDTIVPNPMDPLSLNRFAFVEGNPLTNRDPSGHGCEEGEPVTSGENALTAGCAAGVDETGGAWIDGQFTEVDDGINMEEWLQQFERGVSQETQVIEGAFRELTDEASLDTESATAVPVGEANPLANRSSADAGSESRDEVTSDLASVSDLRMQIRSELDRRLSAIGPGPSAGESIPARSSGRAFTTEEQKAIDQIGRTTGCHTCGSIDPGTESGHFVLDHQPATQLRVNMAQRLYPQCLACSRAQGGRVTQYMRLLRAYLALGEEQQ